MMPKLIFYTKNQCTLCDEALDILSLFREDFSFDIEYRDIYTNDEWLETYQLLIPVIDINGEQLNGEQISYENIERLLKQHL